MNRLSPKTVSLQSIHFIMNDETKNQPIEDQEWLRPLTMEEIDAMLDEAEAAFEAGLGIPNEVVFRQLEEDFADISPLSGIPEGNPKNKPTN